MSGYSLVTITVLHKKPTFPPPLCAEQFFFVQEENRDARNGQQIAGFANSNCLQQLSLTVQSVRQRRTPQPDSIATEGSFLSQLVMVIWLSSGGWGKRKNLTDERTARRCRRKPFRFRKLLNQRAARLAKVFCKMPCSRIKSRLQFRLGSIHYISSPNLPDTQGIACWSRSSFIVETSLRGCDARFL